MNLLLNELIEKNKHLTLKGKLADYIPALNDKNRQEHLGVSIVDEEGNLYSQGDSEVKFTIQSISKVMGFILAIKDSGIDRVFEKVGCVSSDEPFDYFINLDLPTVYKPANPMINAGALVITSLIKGEKEEKFQKLLELTRFMAGNEKINLNEEIYLSEKRTGNRNKSMAYLLKYKSILEGEVEDVLDTYFRQCSIEVTTVDLARIGSFISKGCKGIEAKTIKDKELSKLLKGILFNCGMYNYSTEYSIQVGVPSKSGVGGGIMGVLPNNSGIGVYSPALDLNGNSLAGIRVMEDLSNKLNWNLLVR